jgi:hypothetical protein
MLLWTNEIKKKYELKIKLKSLGKITKIAQIAPSRPKS